ncbi:hypothetical protein DM02DRAFT_608377 [Periconia macrospinosa]|uniref:Uncharacterized protein n=1 Tax=Periconia macrospinosa TaxID=97972 RepID=A0A2V1EEN6_9PLEO|nr:hypothetical protein DM02DRAFT_608377 [Periconia macrospinosa]
MLLQITNPPPPPSFHLDNPAQPASPEHRITSQSTSRASKKQKKNKQTLNPFFPPLSHSERKKKGPGG